MKHYKRVFIVGHPGAGKALLAKTLAEKLGWQFMDADFGLEFRIGRQLNDILGIEGQEMFFECQSLILSKLLNQENVVVTTDACIIDSERNRELLSSELTVYLQVSIPVQLTRNARNPNPQLLPRENLKEFLNKLHRNRDELYDQTASRAVNSDDSALESHVAIIAKLIKQNIDQEDKDIYLDKSDINIFHKTLHIPIQLTNAQAKCLKLLAQGKSSKEIARELNISYRTVEGTIAKLMEVLGCDSSKELIALYHGKP
jgi:shikimate kinase